MLSASKMITAIILNHIGPIVLIAITWHCEKIDKISHPWELSKVKVQTGLGLMCCVILKCAPMFWVSDCVLVSVADYN